MEVSSHDKGIDFPVHWKCNGVSCGCKKDNAAIHLSGRSSDEEKAIVKNCEGGDRMQEEKPLP
jgi:hypothetical protein